MSKKDEALKLALEALEEYVNVVVSANDQNEWTPKVVDAGGPARKAITALREALAEQPAPVQQRLKLVPYEPSIDMQEHGSIASGYDLSQARAKKVYQAMIDMHDVMMEREPTDEWFRLQAGYPEQPAQQALDKKAENARELGLDYEPAQPRAWFTIDELNAWADKKLKENPQWAEQPAQQEAQAEETVKERTPQERRDAGEWHCPECFTFGHQHRQGCTAAHGIKENA